MWAISHSATNPTISHITPQSSQVLVAPANPIDIRAINYLHIVVDIRLKGRIIDVIGSAGANLLKCRLSTKHYNHVADLGYRNRPSEDMPAELSSLNSRDSNAQSAL